MAEPCWATRATAPDGALGTPVKRDETNSGTSGSAGRGRGQGARARWTLGEWSAGHRVGSDLSGDVCDQSHKGKGKKGRARASACDEDLLYASFVVVSTSIESKQPIVTATLKYGYTQAITEKDTIKAI